MSSYDNLLARVKLVRRRWHIQMTVKGLSLFVASTIALLVLGVWGGNLFGFRPAAVWLMRVATGAAVVFVGWRFLYMPLRRRIADVQIAQYIEERYPQLEDRLITAVEFGRKQGTSSGMLDLLIRDALEKTNRVDFSVFVNRKRLAYFGLLGFASFLVLFALLNWGPSFFPYGFDRLYVPWTEAAFGASLGIQVTPGNAEIARGSDQQIKAQLIGFDSPDVRIYAQPETATSWTPAPMEPEPAGSGFLYLLIDVQSPLRYYVESKGVRSPTFTVKVVDIPRVEKISLTYNFPAYTGMPPQTVENEGDISALKGTKVDLRIHLSRPSGSARLLFDDQSTLDLTPEGKQDIIGSLTLKRSGSYVVQLAGEGGARHAGSTEYEIEALDDAPPKVTVTKPLRDVRATNVEEVFSEVKAEDDIGISKVELHYSVNGESEKTVALHGGKPGETAVTASHTFFLEEFELQPGDVVAYYGQATDNNNVTGPGTSSSDIYFIQIRPFEQKYIQNQQGGGPGGGGGGESSQESLSRQQKEIIAATFKLIRDKNKMDPKEYVDSLKALSLVQSRLQLQTQGLIERMQRRGAAEVNQQFAALAEYLKTAMREMEKASVLLGAQKPADALPEEEKALQQLMRAESLFREIQVSFANASGGGGSQTNAEDLADLFELELNKLKNQYETVQRGEQQARDQKLDEALQRLKELAQRQQQLNERNRLMGQRGAPSASSGGGGQSQQQVLDEVEKLQRQLQRLSRERSSPELNQAASQLQKAIDEMKKALQGSQRGNSGEATAQGIRALQQLDETKRRLARGQEAGLSQGVDQAAAEAKRLLEEQKKIQEGVDRLVQEKQQAGTPEFQKRTQDLVGRKTALADSLKGLGGKIENLSREARKTQKETSNKLNDAAGTIRDKKLPERIMSNNQLLQNRYLDFVKGREDLIRSGLEELDRQLEAARNSIGQTKEGKLEDAANKARQLAEGLEASQQRLREMQRSSGKQSGSEGEQAQQRGPQGQQGQSPSSPAQSGQQPGSQGSQGQRGQQAGSLGGQGSTPQSARGGQPGADVRSATGNLSGPPTGMGTHRDEDIRQLNRDLQQRLMDAQDLRRLLDRNSSNMQNLEQVIESLRRAGDSRKYGDPEMVAQLKGAIDLLHQVELDLNRELSRLTQKEKYFYAEDSEAPSSYKKLVEEYYKALAKGKPQ